MVKSLNKNISTPIAVSIILLVAILAGGILALQYWKLFGKANPQISNQKERGEINKTGEDKNDDWKIYQSPTMGFVMKYPPDWTTTPEIVEDGGKRVTFQGPGEVELGTELVIMRGVSHYSYDKGRELSCEDESGVDKKEIVLDNLSAFMSTIYYPEATKATYICEESKRTEIYFIIYDYNEDKENLYYPILNKMLSTFEITGDINFSESYNSSIFEDWKVYKNHEYGFEVKYPSEDYEISAGPAIISDKWGVMVIFEIHNNPSSLSLTEWAANYYPSIKWRNILVNNLESLMSPHSAYIDSENQIPGKWKVLIYKKDKIVEIVFSGWGAEGESSKLDNILSTFMFLK